MPAPLFPFIRSRRPALPREPIPSCAANWARQYSYEVDIDLPGFNKDQIQLSLENGYLTVTATKAVEKDKEKKGRTIRQERYDGTLQRSFYVGEALTEEDITAKLEHGVLSLSIPKKAEKKLPEKKLIAIEG